MIGVKHLDIAVVGDEDLVNALRLAGVGRYHMIKGDDVGGEVRKALTAFIEDPDIGVVAIAENYADYVEDLLTPFREGRKLTPVIIEVPSGYAASYPDVRQYYAAYIKKFIGFEIEI